jgi:hypothetical protein
LVITAMLSGCSPSRTQVSASIWRCSGVTIGRSHGAANWSSRSRKVKASCVSPMVAAVAAAKSSRSRAVTSSRRAVGSQNLRLNARQLLGDQRGQAELAIDLPRKAVERLHQRQRLAWGGDTRDGQGLRRRAGVGQCLPALLNQPGVGAIDRAFLDLELIGSRRASVRRAAPPARAAPVCCGLRIVRRLSRAKRQAESS